MEKVLKRLGIDPETVNYDVHIVTPEEIRNLKKEYLGIDMETDVLSFPMLELTAGQIPKTKDFPNDVNPETGRIELGDIVVNENEPDREGLIEHGLLHLLGFHHDDHKE